MDLFFAHSTHEWHAWAFTLPSSGFGGWTRSQWLDWIEGMNAHKVQIDRLKQTMEEEVRKAPYWAGKSPAGSQAETCYSCKPATGEPSQGTGSAPSNSQVEQHKLRDSMRSFTMWKPSLADAPPLCNRVKSGWGMQPARCHCQEWPSWLSAHASTILAKDVTAEIADSEQRIGKVLIGQKVEYWRPGRMGVKWWFPGEVKALKEVTFPSGQSRLVVGLS